jgi:toxin ParE1/3/4
MKVEYSNRAVADLRKISADTRRLFGDDAAQALERRIERVINQIGTNPLSAPEVEQRPGLRVIPLVPYPFKIFYRVFANRIRIQHIRHAARRSWPRTP